MQNQKKAGGRNMISKLLFRLILWKYHRFLLPAAYICFFYNRDRMLNNLLNTYVFKLLRSESNQERKPNLI
jgi:hypothetical protein